MSSRDSEPRADESISVTTGAAESSAVTDDGRGTRIVTTAVGSALVGLGLRRRSLPGAVLALSGGWLLYRGLRGGRRRSRTLEPSTPTAQEWDAEAADGEVAVTRSITVGLPAADLTEFWRDPDRVSQIMGHFADVSAVGPDRYRWRVDGPLGRELAWETEITEAEPGDHVRWESLEGAPIPNAGTVRFRPASGDRGTQVTLRLQFEPPGGSLGTAVLEYAGIVPGTIASTALRRFKSLAETGEIPTLERNPSARGSGDVV